MVSRQKITNAPSKVRKRIRQFPDDPVPLRFLEKFGGITTWMIGGIIVGLVNTGVMWQQFQEVKSRQVDEARERREMAVKLATYRENQINGLNKLDTLHGAVQTLDNRVLIIERVFIQPQGQPGAPGLTGPQGIPGPQGQPGRGR